MERLLALCKRFNLRFVLKSNEDSNEDFGLFNLHIMGPGEKDDFYGGFAIEDITDFNHRLNDLVDEYKSLTPEVK